MNNKKLILYILIVITLSISAFGFTYSYIVVGILGNDDASSLIVNTTVLELVYSDTQLMDGTHVSPGWSDSKTFSIRNDSNITVMYDIIWENLENNLTHKDTLVYSITPVNGGKTLSTRQVPDSGENILILDDISVNPGETQTYNFTIEYMNVSYDQSSDMQSTFNGKLAIVDYTLYSDMLFNGYKELEYVQINNDDTNGYNNKVLTDIPFNISNKIEFTYSSLDTYQYILFLCALTDTNAVSQPYFANNDLHPQLTEFTNSVSGLSRSELTNGTKIDVTLTYNALSNYKISFGSWADNVWSRTVKWYSFKIYNNNTLLSSMVPCKRLSDNNVGFCDIISNKFHTNMGSGVFTS